MHPTFSENLMTLGQKIRESRRARRMTQQAVADLAAISRPTLVELEKDVRKPADEVVIRLADALEDPTVLTHRCAVCPVREAALFRLLPGLNNLRRDGPAAVAVRVKGEMVEAMEDLDRLIDCMGDLDLARRADYRDVYKQAMQQVIDVKRGIETLEFEFLVNGAHALAELREVYRRRRAKRAPEDASEEAAHG
jgi:transcriptional regulator with XRE-family HTH domain